MSIQINTNSGGNQNWDNVLSQGGYLTQSRLFNFYENSLDFNLVGQFNINLSNDINSQFRILLNNYYYFNFFNSEGNYIKIYFHDIDSDDNNLFYLFYDDNDTIVSLGDFAGRKNGTYLSIDDFNQNIYLVSNNIFINGNQQIVLETYNLNINTPTFGGAHPTSGQHLKVIVNGTTYYLQLLT